LIDEYAYFKVTGSGSCENVTKIIGRKPNKAWSEGDLRPRGNSVYPFMMWTLDSGLEKTVPVEQHIEELFLWLNHKALAIRNLAPDYECLIQCVGTFDSSHGIHIRPDQVRQAAHMGIGFSMDFYVTEELENDS
jgi:hypothetical protein